MAVEAGDMESDWTPDVETAEIDGIDDLAEGLKFRRIKGERWQQYLIERGSWSVGYHPESLYSVLLSHMAAMQRENAEQQTTISDLEIKVNELRLRIPDLLP